MTHTCFDHPDQPCAACAASRRARTTGNTTTVLPVRDFSCGCVQLSDGTVNLCPWHHVAEREFIHGRPGGVVPRGVLKA